MQISEAAKKAALDLVPEHQQKVCPYCGSSRIGIFDSDNDSCMECKKWWCAGSHRVIMLRDSGELKRNELRIQQACEEYARNLSDYKAKELAEKAAEIERMREDAEIGSFLRSEIKGMCEAAGMDMSGTPPMMYPEAILALMQKRITALELAIDNAGMDVSPCRECGDPVVCVPDGLGTYCEKCAEKLGVQAAKDFMDELGKPF